MLWVWVFVGIALAGLVMLVAYGVWLAHKLSDVMSEVGVLMARTGELAVLLGQIELSQSGMSDVATDGVPPLPTPGSPTPATYDDKGVTLVAPEERDHDSAYRRARRT